MALVNKKFSDIITFSRASNATVTGSDGLIQYAPHNLLTYSEQFDNAAWVKTNATITANAIAAPDGTVTADKLVADATLAQHRVNYTTTIAAGTYTFSVYLKAGGYSAVLVRIGTSGGWVDLTNGSVSSVVGGYTMTATLVSNGWYRVSLSGAAALNEVVRVNASPTVLVTDFSGNGVDGIYVWGAQLSVGPLALSYTPTTSAAVYGPRFDYDPVSMAPKGLLVEEQRTNLLTYSEQFDNAAWTKAGTSVAANAVAAPDGTVTADKLVEDSATSTHQTVQSVSTSASAYTFSVYVKAAGRNYVMLYNTTAGFAKVFDISTGVVGTGTVGTVSASIQSVGNGWYKCAITGTATAAANDFRVYVLTSDTTTAAYTGDGTSGVYLWGAQLEAGAFATSYIPTVASQVTRSADVASVNTLSPWYNATEGTLYASGDFFSTASTTYSMAAFNSGSSAESISLVNYGGTPRLLVISSSTTQAELTSGSTGAGVVNNMAGAYASNNFAYSRNGSAASTDTSGTVPSVNTFSIGALVGSTNPLNGHIRRIAYFPRRLTNSELQALTA